MSFFSTSNSLKALFLFTSSCRLLLPQPTCFMFLQSYKNNFPQISLLILENVSLKQLNLQTSFLLPPSLALSLSLLLRYHHQHHHHSPTPVSSEKVICEPGALANKCTHQLWQHSCSTLIWETASTGKRNQLECGVGLVLRGCWPYFIPAHLSPVYELIASLAWLWTFALIKGGRWH